MSEKVAVVFGGVSNENEISVITGVMAVNVLAESGVEVIPVYISARGDFYAGAELAKLNTFRQNNFENCMRAVIADGGIYLFNRRGKCKKHIAADCVLNCCHGGWGEGGGLSGVCAAAKLPLAGAPMFGSAAFMDKYFTKIVLSGLKVKTAPYVYVREGGRCSAAKLGFPVIVKPATLGSSIGVSRADNAEELKCALDCAFVYDCAAVVEKYFSDKREINCAAFRSGDSVCVSECEESLSEGEIFSYKDKYEGGGKSVIPADIPPDISARIRETTRKVYEALNMSGIVRFDYILADDVYLSEVNTVPGSLAFYLFSDGFKSFGNILRSLIAQAERDFKSSQKQLLTTGILNDLPLNACKINKK